MQQTLLPVLQSAGVEASRLAAVMRYDILDTPPDGAFDRITELAARLLKVPISIISLVDHDRIWFKSHHGLDATQIDREPGLCASAIMQIDPYILTDAKTDIRSLANPLVAGSFGLRFYVGVPLRTHDGFNLGTLCVIDSEPRPISEDEIAQLKSLATLVMDQMELRLSARNAVADLSGALHRAEMMAKEIDHRVMNSLQLVAGLLNLQSRALGTSDASNQLSVAATRVLAIARVHQHIYLTEGVEHTDAKGYLERLCSDLSTVAIADNRGGIRVDAVRADIPTHQIVPIGLVVNELVTNALKHGLGEIRVSFERAGAEYCLTVADEGNGPPSESDSGDRKGLGMKVTRLLAQQLQGKLTVSGPEFTVTFPASS